MKKTLIVGVALTFLYALVATFLSQPAGAATPCTGSQTATVTNDPDSGNHGNWAVDTTFTRVTTVLPDCSGVRIDDSGSFDTIPNAHSPHLGALLPATALKGTFHGSISLTFKATENQAQIDGLLAGLPKTVPSPTSSVTGEWADKLQANENDDWSWTYHTTDTCETWVDAANNKDGASDRAGDIQGRSLCKVHPVTSAPTAPTTTPVAVGGTGSTGGSASSGGSGAQVAAVPVGAPQTGDGSTAGNDEWELYAVWAFVVASLAALLWHKQVRSFGRKVVARISRD